MAREYVPGDLHRIPLLLEPVGKLQTRAGLIKVAAALERQAKINATNGSHKPHTKTPAQSGNGPAIITGTLRRSIIRTPIVYTAEGYEIRVGMAAGVYPPSTRSTKKSKGVARTTASSKYAEFLETGAIPGGAAYPFLLPAFRFAVTVVAPQFLAFREWPRF